MTRRPLPAAFALAIIAASFGGRADAASDDDTTAPPPQAWAIHGQATLVWQAMPGFHSPYEGENSLSPIARGRETASLGLAAGARLWSGAEIWSDGEIVQGSDLSGSKGVAGFLNGEAPRDEAGGVHPRLEHLFLRQTVDLGGRREAVKDEEETLNGWRPADRLVLTVGRFSVADIFDLNDYAHDTREDFLSGAVSSAGTFDFASDRAGYTLGGAAEIYLGRWTVRAGVFALPTEPGGDNIDATFGERQLIGEIERRYTIADHDGSLKITGFDTQADQGLYADALALARADGGPPNLDAVGERRIRLGVSLDLQQNLGDSLGVFARAGWADGRVQGYSFSDIDRSVSAGLSLSGDRWGREDDTIGLGAALDFASADFTAYLADGGLGLTVGDGKLPHPGPEGIVETYYQLAITQKLAATFDYEFVNNPGYNRDRGPASIFALRLHAAF